MRRDNSTVHRWTAEYVMLRGLGRLHVFPGDDVGAHNTLRRFFRAETALHYGSVKRLGVRKRGEATLRS